MPHNPHDKLFKAVFSEPENAMAHFEVCLPPALVTALDLSKAQHVPGSWVDEALKDHHSDVAHSIPLRRADAADIADATDVADNDTDAESALLYTIWEHQSTVDLMLPLRTHRYTTRLLEDWNREHPGQSLPPVIVLVLYHGKAEWTAPVELEELFALGGLDREAREALRPYLPKQRYLLEVLPAEPTEVRSGPGAARIALLALKFGPSPDLWMAIFESEEDLRQIPSEGPELLHLAALLVEYLLTVNPELTPDELSEALKPMGTEAQELPKTYHLRMVEKSRQEGLEEGRRQSQRETARKALAKGMSPAEVSELTELSLEEVQKLAH